MFGRKQGAAGVASDALDSVTPFVDQLANDEKFRQRLVAAISAAVAAREQARRQVGLIGLGTRLGSDPILRARLVEATKQLQKARGRLRKQKKSHTTRNTVLFLTGAGIVVAAMPKLRQTVVAKARELSKTGTSSVVPGSRPTSIEQQIEVDAPVSAVYDQWTKFEQFPKFMEGVDEVKQLDDTLLHWAVTVAGKKAEWDAKITEKSPDRRIAWESIDGKQNRGVVSFEPVGKGAKTRIRLHMSYLAEGAAESVGSAVGLDERRVRGDLERFRELVENGKPTS